MGAQSTVNGTYARVGPGDRKFLGVHRPVEGGGDNPTATTRLILIPMAWGAYFWTAPRFEWPCAGCIGSWTRYRASSESSSPPSSTPSSWRATATARTTRIRTVSCRQNGTPYPCTSVRKHGCKNGGRRSPPTMMTTYPTGEKPLTRRMIENYRPGRRHVQRHHRTPPFRPGSAWHPAH